MMFKIWAKTVKKEKITKSYVYKGEDKFDSKLLSKYLPEMCEQMDIPTPVLLNSHIKNFDAFGITRFTKSDFVESVDFDFFTLEYCKDEHGEKKHLYKAYLPVD
ncbi:MAG: hypothetical protein IKC35_02365 [Clostridia bacterium]|nr:hypothetical protein [Clostridia bacterium]